jgi:HK97 family phage portal protein
LIEQVAARKRALDARKGRRAWPVGAGSVLAGAQVWGHDDSRFSPEEYGDYLPTSNEIYSAATLRARLMSGLRLRLYRGDDSDKRAMPTHPASRLLEYVNPHWTPRRLARMDELAMCVWGESYWAVERDPVTRRPTEIWWMRPPQVRPVPHEEKYLQGFLYTPAFGGRDIRFDADEVVWFRYPNPLDEFSALSPLAAARLAADAATAMMKSNEKLFRQGLQLAGRIVPPADKVSFSTEQADELEDRLQRRFAGADRAHRWAVMRFEAQFKQLQMSPKDAEFVTGLGLTLRQVANAYGIPTPLLNDMAGATLANVDAFTKLLWQHALVPDSQLRAGEVEEQFLPMFGRGAPDHAEHDYSQVAALQESQSQTWTRDAQALDRGALTINEWRRRNGLPDVPWGDEPWLPVNKAQVVDGQMAVPATQSLPDDETNPANQPAQSTGGTTEPDQRLFDHHAARRLIAEAFGGVNGRALHR